ncbi:MAG: aldolase/citrate lyase family protein [Eubacteriales bacterium]
MFCTNRPDVAAIAEEAGVDRIWVDMEYLGKAQRQGGMDTLQSRHTPADVAAVRQVIRRGEIVVRVNPMHEGQPGLASTAEEVDAVIAAGADLVMLPYFKTADQVRRFVDMVGGRARVFPLLETPEAVETLDDILSIPGIDEMHIGINDLSLGYGKKFLFELVTDGTVERLCLRLRESGLPFGFGGFGGLGRGAVPAERLIAEHYRLGSTRAILSRSFCKVEEIGDMETIRRTFREGIPAIRAYEAKACEALREGDTAFFRDSRQAMEKEVAAVVAEKEKKERGGSV